jgi:endonuclease/exonuclease/phosphatase family metal-dependent hydrolase
MNLVGRASQVRTLLAGEIADEESFGPSHSADWDASPLADAEPRHAGGRDTFTWRDASSSFAPGRLDYIVFSDSVARLGNSFVLATEELDDATLDRYDLRRDDTLEASDHLPVVADLRIDGGRARAGAAE